MSPLEVNLALINACAVGDVQGVEHYIACDADVYYHNHKAFLSACEYGHLEVVELLSQKYKSYNPKGLTEALKNGHTDIVDYMVTTLAITLTKNAAKTALRHGSSTLKHMIDKYEVDVSDHIAMWMAITNRDTESIDLLVGIGDNPYNPSIDIKRLMYSPVLEHLTLHHELSKQPRIVAYVMKNPDTKARYTAVMERMTLGNIPPGRARSVQKI